MGKIKKNLDDWFNYSQSAELHWMEQEYLQSQKQKNARRKNKPTR